jgi:hypothetical protein
MAYAPLQYPRICRRLGLESPEKQRTFITVACFVMLGCTAMDSLFDRHLFLVLVCTIAAILAPLLVEELLSKFLCSPSKVRRVSKSISHWKNKQEGLNSPSYEESEHTKKKRCLGDSTTVTEGPVTKGTEGPSSTMEMGEPNVEDPDTMASGGPDATETEEPGTMGMEWDSFRGLFYSMVNSANVTSTSNKCPVSVSQLFQKKQVCLNPIMFFHHTITKYAKAWHLHYPLIATKQHSEGNTCHCWQHLDKLKTGHKDTEFKSVT